MTRDVIGDMVESRELTGRELTGRELTGRELTVAQSLCSSGVVSDLLW